MSDSAANTSHKAKVRLTGLKTKEVSLVDRPAIEEEFNVRKNKGESTMPNASKPDSGSAETGKVAKAGEAHAALVDEKIEAFVKLANELVASAPTALKLDWDSDERKEFCSKMYEMEDLAWSTYSPAKVVATLSKRLTTAVESLKKSNEETETVLGEAAKVAKSVVAAVTKVSGMGMMDTEDMEDMEDDDMKKAAWTTAYINTLPDSSFLYIEPGGEKDDEGKTTPRSLRHFPVKDENGKVDVPHVRNALARIPQSSVPQGAKDKATAAADKLLAAAKEEKGDDMAEETKKTDAAATTETTATAESVAKGTEAKPAAAPAVPSAVEKRVADTQAGLEKVQKDVEGLSGKVDDVLKKLDEFMKTHTPGNAATVPDGNAAPVEKADNIWAGAI